MNEQDTTTIPWPLIFSYTGTIAGRGFLAEVQMRGRLLATPEVEGVWIDGVNPGALALGAPTLVQANMDLRQVLTRLFIDFAGEAPTFDDFRSRVERYFHESDDDTEREWSDAVVAVREGRVPVPEGLPKTAADGECFVTVSRKPIEQVTPGDNILIQQEAQPALAAAA